MEVLRAYVLYVHLECINAPFCWLFPQSEPSNVRRPIEARGLPAATRHQICLLRGRD